MNEATTFRTEYTITLAKAESGEWAAIVHSALENKQVSFVKPNLKPLLIEAYKRIRKRVLLNRRFPIEEQRIITLAQSAPSIITPNGR